MTDPVRPPDLDHELAVPYWEGFKQGEIRLPRCEQCDEFHWYPKHRCPFCRSEAIQWDAIEGVGTLFTWVGVEYDFKLPFLTDATPLYTGLVVPEEDDGIRLAALIHPPESDTPEIGMELKATFPESATEHPVPVYVPR